MIYTSPSFGNEYLTDERFTQYPLWIANYNVSEPSVPSAWGNKGWDFWQYSQKGNVEGIEGDVDLDTFNGTLEQLQQFISSQNI